MSPYATELAHARLDALRALIDALKQAETPDEKRRCAVAIFNAPDPSDLDDEIELDDEFQEAEDEDEEAEQVAADQHTDTQDNPELEHASAASTTSPSEPPHSSSDIQRPTSPIAPLSPAESRLRAREARSQSELHHILAQLPALPIPAS